MAWFRVYDTMVDDPKVQRLPAALFKALINLWCLASQHDGILPPCADIAFKLRVSEDAVGTILSALRAAGLIDMEPLRNPHGTLEEPAGNRHGTFSPHNWRGRQFKSDLSTERVKKHRKQRHKASETLHETFHATAPDRFCNGHVTPPDTDTDTDTDTERKKVSGGADAPAAQDCLVEAAPVYAFAGKIIRLKQEQYDRWRRIYAKIPEFDATLQVMDDYYTTHPPPNGHWFFAASNWLKRDNDNADIRRQEEMRRRGHAW